MQLQIEIINVASTTKPTSKGGSYVQLDVAYRRLDTGKVEGKKIMSFTNKDVFDALNGLPGGTQVTVTSEKNEKSGYWDWTAVTVGGVAQDKPATPKAGGGNPTPKSTYETAEERAARQVLIVRQSSLSAAIATLKVDKSPADPSEVMKIADVYSNWVFQKDCACPVDVFDNMEDDIPM